LKIRRDSVFVSSVLFTIALGCLIPANLANAKAGGHNAQLELGPAWGAVASLYHQLGIASLTIIFIGLMVTWAGYANRIRWTWFVMFIIVWGWAFPLLILPLFRALSVSVSELFLQSLKEPGIARTAVEEILIFSLMLIALILPIKAYTFRSGKPNVNM
jgi:hypothetical protein